jgi:hypothetical protein
MQVGKGGLAMFPLYGFVRDRRHICMGWKGARISPRLESVLKRRFQGEKPMKFPESCIDIRRCTKVAGIVISNLMFYQKHQ